MKDTEQKNESQTHQGRVVKAFGNLIQVEFNGHIRQGEVGMIQVGDETLKAEVIEIAGTLAKLQVFEDSRGIHLNAQVKFTGNLLEAELGPGLLTSIFDGLQNPLEDVAAQSGYFLPRGVYLPPLDREKKWDYKPVATVGDTLTRGQTIGQTNESRFTHRIMVPFSMYGSYTLTWIIEPGDYNIDTVVAKAKDEEGNEHSFTMVQKWPMKQPLLEGEKIKPYEIMDTGLRTLDTQFPMLKGGTFCTPGPFGAGKTVLQHHLAKYSAVDIVVVIACGERAGEVVEVLKEFPHLVDPHTGESLMNRTIIICNTSSMPVAARESSVYLGVTIAEYFRQMGLNVLALADSTSRWAQAMREMSGRLEEIPGEEAFPAYLSSRIAEFYERAGAIELADGDKGSLTIGGAVSPAGGNFEEPVTQATLSVVGAFLGLSRSRSDARRYPAIDPLISWSKYRLRAAELMSNQLETWGDIVKSADHFLVRGDEIGKQMEVVGEEGTAIEDLIIYLKSELFDFCYLQQNAFDPEDCYFPLPRQIALIKLVELIFNTDFKLESHDQARQVFLQIQNKVKNLNYLPYDSESFKTQYAETQQFIRDNSNNEAGQAQ